MIRSNLVYLYGNHAVWAEETAYFTNRQRRSKKKLQIISEWICSREKWKFKGWIKVFKSWYHNQNFGKFIHLFTLFINFCYWAVLAVSSYFHPPFWDRTTIQYLSANDIYYVQNLHLMIYNTVHQCSVARWEVNVCRFNERRHWWSQFFWLFLLWTGGCTGVLCVCHFIAGLTDHKLSLANWCARLINVFSNQFRISERHHFLMNTELSVWCCCVSFLGWDVPLRLGDTSRWHNN